MMCRSSTTTMGSRVVSMTTSGESTGGAFSFRSATAVPLLRAVEPPETDDQEDHCPQDGVAPERSGLCVRGGLVVGVRLDHVLADEFHVDIAGVRLKNILDPRMFLDVAAAVQLSERVDHTGDVEPGPKDERDQL